MKIRCKVLVVLTILSVVPFASAGAQPRPDLTDVDYEGTWASNTAVRDSTYGSTFLHVKRVAENRYFVMSTSNTLDFFTYVGGGFIRDDGFLQVHSDKGDTWLYTPTQMFGRPDEISMTDLDNIESFNVYVRIEDKFTEWPFPTAPEK